MHDLTCPLVGYPYPGVNCTAQMLKINDWPEQLRVTEIISSSERFTEYCIQLNIPVVRLSASPTADQERIKHLEDFCNTLRSNPYFALVRLNPQVTAPPFHGLFLTFFRNSLVVLPFLNYPITSDIIHVLTQFATGPNNNPVSGATMASNLPLSVASTPVVSGAPSNGGSGQPNIGGMSNPAASLMMTPQQSAAALPMSGMSNTAVVTAAMAAAGLLARNNNNNGQSQTGTAPTTGAQQIMSPMQAFAARPNIASPAMGGSAGGSHFPSQQFQALIGLLKSHYSPEVIE
ncbi:hypothetical protein LPJ74_006787, partial [Coemansia sp. RSA 1843]